jgi:hypothetical protein
MQLRKRWGMYTVLVAAMVIFNRNNASADTELQLSKWVEQVKISGDFRLRQENFDKN